MKKLSLLLMLMLPFAGVSQNVLFEIKTFDRLTGNSVNSTESIVEMEELTMELRMKVSTQEDYALLEDVKYLFLDIQYNHDVFQYLEEGPEGFPWEEGTAGTYITQLYRYGNLASNQIQEDLLGNYNAWVAGQTQYIDDASQSVVRIAIQLGESNVQDFIDPTTLESLDPIYFSTFSIKPESSSNEQREFKIVLANMEKSNGNQVDQVLSTQTAYEVAIVPPVSYNPTLKFRLPSSLDPTNFKVRIMRTNVTTNTNVDEIYELDASGEVILADVGEDEEIFVTTLEPINSSYLPDVHTITDAYRAFQYLTDVGPNGGQVTYDNWEGFTADINLDQVLNSGDTYGFLAYIAGLDIAAMEEGGYCLPAINVESQEWYHGCTATVPYEDYTPEVIGAAMANDEWWDSRIIPTEEELYFEFAFFHHGDVDQSHSTAYPADVSTSSKSASKVKTTYSREAVGTVNIDMISTIGTENIEVELNHSSGDIVGLQARLHYDTSKLVLKDIIYDTGNTLTNFAKPSNGELIFGTISVDGSEYVKKGNTFKLIFSPIGEVSNLTGLFYFNNTDAVRKNGDKMNLNID